jgi:ankyrin repeat protein
MRTIQQIRHYLLLDAGALANVSDASGDTLLRQAMHNNQSQLFSKPLKYGADVSRIDQYGRSCLDYAVCFSEILKRLSITPTTTLADLDARKTRLFDTALSSIETVLTSDSKLEAAYPTLRHLGHCLVFPEWLNEAVAVYQMTIFAATEPATGFRHRAFCDGCSADCPNKSLRVCWTCRDVDLCDLCFEMYQACTLRDIFLCKSHEFLEIPLVPFDKKYTQFLPKVTPKVRDYLLQLKENVSRKVSDRSVSDLTLLTRANTLVNRDEDTKFDVVTTSFSVKSRESRIHIEEYVDLNGFALYPTVTT